MRGRVQLDCAMGCVALNCIELEIGYRMCR